MKNGFIEREVLGDHGWKFFLKLQLAGSGILVDMLYNGCVAFE